MSGFDMEVENETPADRSFAGLHGTDSTVSRSLDRTALVAGTHYPDGYVPAGIVVGQVTATKRVKPALVASADGSEDPIGFTFSDAKGTNVGSEPIAVLTHGVIYTKRLPPGHGLTAGMRTALEASGQFRFEDD